MYYTLGVSDNLPWQVEGVHLRLEIDDHLGTLELGILGVYILPCIIQGFVHFLVQRTEGQLIAVG